MFFCKFLLALIPISTITFSDYFTMNEERRNKWRRRKRKTDFITVNIGKKTKSSSKGG